MSNIFLNGNRAIKIKAKEIWPSRKANLYDCEGDERWISKKYSEYNEKEQTIIIEEWYYTKYLFKM